MRESRDQQYSSSQTLERLLNQAIIHADISNSFEEYIEIFDTFYADDIEVSSDVTGEPVRGKSRVRSLLFNFLVPLHVMAEVAGLSVSIRETALPADAAIETHSAWTLDLVGPSGRAACTLTWRTLRVWNGAQVVQERQYDHQQTGGPLTLDDFALNTAHQVPGFRRQS
jgi:hypothetical protein